MLTTLFQLIDFTVNLGFAILSLLIIAAFIIKFKGNIPIRQANVLGFILMAVGLSVHIILHLTAVLLADTIGHSIHILATLISLAVTSFVLGSILIAYHNAETTKSFIKISAVIYTVIGSVIAMTHLLVYFNLADENIVRNFETGFFVFEMIILTFVYTLMFIQSNSSVRRATTIRLRLMSIASLGFAMVIIVDSLIRLGYIAIGDLTLFILFFVLHVITVGSFYLLIIFPNWFKDRFVKSH